MFNLKLYTDGSYCKDQGRQDTTYGAYCAPQYPNIKETFKTTVPEAVAMWNVGGEILGAICAIRFACACADELKKQNDSLELELYYDYEGVGKWITGEWRAKKPLTQKYVRYVNNMLGSRDNISLKLFWVHGHDGNAGNEMADDLAKNAYMSDECTNVDELITNILKG